MHDFKEEAKQMETFCTLEDWYETEKLKGNNVKAKKIMNLLIKKAVTISTKESLKDVIPIDWGNEVLPKP